jgi:ABC-type branched-subunit amino acid transport system ATPase component
MPELVLRTTNVSKSFQGVTALSDVSLELTTRHVTGIIGPNGSGKTTLFNVLSGFNRADRGRVLWGDREITRMPPHRIARLGVVRTFQQTLVFSKLTVWQNVEVATLAIGLRGRERDRMIDWSLELMEIDEFRNDVAGGLPFGVSRRVGIACVLPLRPALLLLDEPAAGMNDDEVKALGAALDAARDERIGLALVDHNMDFIGAFCQHLIVMNAGLVLTEGQPADVLSDPRVSEVYLGHAAAD